MLQAFDTLCAKLRQIPAYRDDRGNSILHLAAAHGASCSFVTSSWILTRAVFRPPGDCDNAFREFRL